MNETFFFFIVVLVILIIIYGIFFSKEATIKRKLKNTAAKDISLFEEGEIAKIIGTIEIIGPPLIAPLSGRSCCYYSIVVEQESGKNNSRSSIIEEEKFSDFFIVSGNSYATVKAQDIKSLLVKDATYSSGFMENATSHLENYLREHSNKSTNFLGLNKKLTYEEGILQNGETVAVVGKGSWKEITDPFSPGKTIKVLTIHGENGEPVYLTDNRELF
jgi:hypothetical protein